MNIWDLKNSLLFLVFVYCFLCLFTVSCVCLLFLVFVYCFLCLLFLQLILQSVVTSPLIQYLITRHNLSTTCWLISQEFRIKHLQHAVNVTKHSLTPRHRYTYKCYSQCVYQSMCVLTDPLLIIN